MKYKIAVASLGCAKNLVDTENMLGFLAEKGHTFVNTPETADVIIINTCSFIGDAKEESINTILDMARFKDEGECKCLVVTGCLAERYHEDIKRELPEVDAIVGTGDFNKICDVINSCMNGQCVCLYGHSEDFTLEGMPRIITTPSHSAYLKIAEGCDNKCTYCVIPSLRGKYRSRTIEDVCEEAEHLADTGVRELILIAQDTTCYGKDIYGKNSLGELLKSLCEIDNIKWIRLHYCYPEGITDELLDVMASNEKILHYFDIPIQHASDSVLKRMGRKTNKASLEKLIHKIREKMDDAIIRTSLIAGFPGEAKEDFNELCDFVEKMRLDRVGVFAYSKEENTPAAKLEGQISERTKIRRRDKLMAIAQAISLEKNEERVGKVYEVLCEGFDEENCLYKGRSYADSIDVDSLVYFGAEREVQNGEFVNVRILCAQEYDLIGEEI
ncbi:MAG: 30S ribosomal protein S12 methylthiotransferase RimO [Ruminococcaceae bacterium]|nr:30S ribosomal protein S12 methylthiotransferase RimO [Oscillospiraceae bacterium]